MPNEQHVRISVSNGVDQSTHPLYKHLHFYGCKESVHFSHLSTCNSRGNRTRKEIMEIAPKLLTIHKYPYKIKSININYSIRNLIFQPPLIDILILPT